jgi:hypothetical protein
MNLAVSPLQMTFSVDDRYKEFMVLCMKYILGTLRYRIFLQDTLGCTCGAAKMDLIWA